MVSIDRHKGHKRTARALSAALHSYGFRRLLHKQYKQGYRRRLVLFAYISVLSSSCLVKRALRLALFELSCLSCQEWVYTSTKTSYMEVLLVPYSLPLFLIDDNRLLGCCRCF
jgi:hypothetical protein